MITIYLYINWYFIGYALFLIHSYSKQVPSLSLFNMVSLESRTGPGMEPEGINGWVHVYVPTCTDAQKQERIPAAAAKTTGRKLWPHFSLKRTLYILVKTIFVKERFSNNNKKRMHRLATDKII